MDADDQLNTESDEPTRRVNTDVDTTDKYPIKNPYFEDKQSYDLQHCIKNTMKPIFGYPIPDFKSKEEFRFDFDMMMPNIIGF